MNNDEYVLSALVLSLTGIALSYLNSRISVCPKNVRHSTALDLGFIVIFLLSIMIAIFGYNIEFMRYGMLFFLLMTVLYVAWKTIAHYFDHVERRQDLCGHKAYNQKLREMYYNDGRDNGVT